MKEKKYIDDLREIKEIMNRSSRFISLSGLSGVSSGIIALIAVYIAFTIAYNDSDYFSYSRVSLSVQTLTILLGIALISIILAIGSGIFFTAQKARKNNQKLWDAQTRRLLINLSIPLVTGGLVCLILLFQGYVGLMAPLTLIFYGLALINASKYTLDELRSLGISEIILGIIGLYFIGFGLVFWAIGFGILHILYGVIMQRKYGS